jgi:rubredoxin
VFKGRRINIEIVLINSNEKASTQITTNTTQDEMPDDLFCPVCFDTLKEVSDLI